MLASIVVSTLGFSPAIAQTPEPLTEVVPDTGEATVEISQAPAPTLSTKCAEPDVRTKVPSVRALPRAGKFPISPPD